MHLDKTIKSGFWVILTEVSHNFLCKCFNSFFIVIDADLNLKETSLDCTIKKFSTMEFWA